MVDAVHSRLIDIVLKNRDAINSEQHNYAASDDYNWRDEDGYPIYSIVVEGQNAMIPSRTIRQTRSLDDAGRYLRGIDPEQNPVSIRVGGLPIFTNRDFKRLEKGAQSFLPFSFDEKDFLKIIDLDKERWKGKNPSIWPGNDVIQGPGKNTYSVGFGAKLDAEYRKGNLPRKVGDIRLSPEVEAILETAERRGVPPHEVNRLAAFGAFVNSAGPKASMQDIEKAWERTIRHTIDPEELAAAWKIRQQEIVGEIKEAVKGAVHKTLSKTISMVSSIWDTFTRSKHKGLGGPSDLMGYASAVLDTSDAVPKSVKEMMPEYMNAYTRGYVMGDHLYFKNTLPKDVADVISPVRFIGDQKVQYWKIDQQLSAHDFLKAVDVIKSKEDNALIFYNGQMSDIKLHVSAMVEQASALRNKDVTTEEARNAGGALYSLLKTMGPVNEQELFQAIDIDKSIITPEIRGALADGFEDALRNDKSLITGPRMTSFLAALDNLQDLQKKTESQPKEVQENVQSAEKTPEKSLGGLSSMSALMAMGAQEQDDVPPDLYLDDNDDDEMAPDAFDNGLG